MWKLQETPVFLRACLDLWGPGFVCRLYRSLDSFACSRFFFADDGISRTLKPGGGSQISVLCCCGFVGDEPLRKVDFVVVVFTLEDCLVFVAFRDQAGLATTSRPKTPPCGGSRGRGSARWPPSPLPSDRC